MKQLSSLFFFFLVFSPTFAQKEDTWSIKVYHNTDIYNKQYINATGERNESVFQANRFSLAIQYHADRKFTHELEVFLPESNKAPDELRFPFRHSFTENPDYKVSVDAYAVRYEVIERISRKNGNITFHTGLSVNPFYYTITNEPQITFLYKERFTNFGFTVALAPHIKFHLSDRVRLNVNIPISLYTLRVEEFKSDDPRVSGPSKQEQKANHRLLPNVYSLRIGLSYQFN